MMRSAIVTAAVAALSLLAGCETTDGRYEPRSSSRSSAQSPLDNILGGLLGGGSGTSSSRTRSDDRVYRDEMDRIETEQRRLDDQRRAIDRRSGRY